MAEKRGNGRSGLVEGTLGNPLLVRPEAEDAKIREPCRHGVSPAPSEIRGCAQVHLIPVPFPADSCRNRITENLSGKT